MLGIPCAYAADHGDSDDLPSAEERTALADQLGCHEEVRAAAWAVWAAELNPLDWDAVQYWLDVEFIEPCPEGRSVQATVCRAAT